MIKLIGAVMIFCGAAAIGISLSARLSARISVLTGILNAIDIMRAEIRGMATPLDELLLKLSLRCDGRVKSFFTDCLLRFDRRGNMSFSEVWRKALDEASYLELAAGERQILFELGDALGRYDSDEQTLFLDNARRQLQTQLDRATGEKAKSGRLYGGLGVVSGIALVIIFL